MRKTPMKFLRTCTVLCILLATGLKVGFSEEIDASTWTWSGRPYSQFCSEFGLGENVGSGIPRFRHVVDGEVVYVTIIDQLDILSISVDGEQADASIETLEFLRPKQFKQRELSESELPVRLSFWLGRSRLVFDNYYGRGRRFRPNFLVYHHRFEPFDIITFNDDNDVIKRIEWRGTDRVWHKVEKRLKAAGTD